MKKMINGDCFEPGALDSTETKRWNKRGSVAIYIMLFSVTLFSFMLTFLFAAREQVIKNTAKECTLLWAESILAEYDRNLLERYGIFGYYGSEETVERKIGFYANQSFGEKPYIAYQGCECTLAEYSLGNLSQVRGQLKEVGTLCLAKEMVHPKPKIVMAEGQIQLCTDSGKVFEDLPSQGCGGGWKLSQVKDLGSNLDSLRSLLAGGGRLVQEDCYMRTYFKDFVTEKDLGATFFSGEMEYIIAGKKSDEANEKRVRRAIMAIREIFNLKYVLENERMNAETMAMAEFLTPGVLAPATQKAIQAAWAAAESYNDYRLLLNGKKVPLFKSASSWAVELSSIVKNGTAAGEEPVFQKKTPYIEVDNQEGNTYEEYLSFLAATMDENVKILRIMDLIQINFRQQYYDGFRLKDYHAGLLLEVKVNGKRCGTIKRYQSE